MSARPEHSSQKWSRLNALSRMLASCSMVTVELTFTLPFFDALSNVVIPRVYIFATIIEGRILTELNGALVVDLQTIQLSKNLVFHDRVKYIDTRYHYNRECMEEGKVKV